jgi:glutathione S-transferase
MTDLTLYDYAASANCLKARVLLAQLGRPYRRVSVDIFAGDTASPEYRRRNPLARTPVLELADGTAIAESGAILLYLAEGTALLPADPVARAHVHQWLFVEQNDVEPNLGRARFWRLTGRDQLSPEVFANCLERRLHHRRPRAVGLRPPGARRRHRPRRPPGGERLDRARRGDAGLRGRPRALSGERAAGPRVAAGAVARQTSRWDVGAVVGAARWQRPWLDMRTSSRCWSLRARAAASPLGLTWPWVVAMPASEPAKAPMVVVTAAR